MTQRPISIALASVCITSSLSLTGAVCWELLTSDIPYKDIGAFDVPVATIEGKRPPLEGPGVLPVDITYTLMVKMCWQNNAKARPTANTV